MPLVEAIYAPNAPFLIAPEAFGGAGGAAAAALRELRVGERHRPDAVVVVTPHWVTRGGFRVQVDPHPRQIYDFGGMPEALHRVVYRPAGDPSLGEALVVAGRAGGLAIEGTTDWGLDHGAWSALMHLFPGATVPVVPVSIVPGRPRDHVALGRAFRSVLEAPGRRVALVATGSIVHDFARFSSDPGARWPEGERIEEAIVARALALDVEGLLGFDPAAWRRVQPEGDLAPLFVLLGAVGDRARPRLVAREFGFGGFSLTTIEFPPAAPP